VRRRFGLAIFDCDGVLVDSEPLSNRIFAEALAEIGLPLDYDEVCRRFIGLSMDRCVSLIEQLHGQRVPADFLPRLQERTFAAFRRELQPVPGIEAALARLRVPACVASSGEHEKMRLTLGLTGLLSRFDGRLFSATEVAHGKPAPDLFLHAAARMGVEPRDCAVIEDSVPGVQAARAAEMEVFGYAARGQQDGLAAAGARVFQEMAELPGLLGE